MDKRGMTLEAVFWLILAVLGIIIVIYGISKVLSLGCMSTEKEQAKTQVLLFKQFLDKLATNDNGTTKIYSPTNWYLISYRKNDVVPPGFFMQNLACICDKEDCSSSYFCEKLMQPAFENTKNLKIKIYFTSLNVTNTGTFYDIRSVTSK